MPFVQMENISHFLRACQSPPLHLQSHDIFQTVDLFDKKDPAQVLQCISAFSRRAHEAAPNRFSTAIGGKSKGSAMSPQSTGGYSGNNGYYARARGTSNSSAGSSTTPGLPPRVSAGRNSPSRSSETSNGGLPTSPSGNVSSWSKRQDEGATTPAWNIHQYGYMGGASQGNQGITFGGRRQITMPAPNVPTLAGKERKRQESEAEAEKLRLQAEEAEQKRRTERAAEEERERIAEEERWAEETRKERDKEQRRIDDEKRRWKDEERRWQEEEEVRAKEEREAEVRLERERLSKRTVSDTRLQGQFLSQYKAEQQVEQQEQRQLPPKPSGEDPERTAERERVKELERQLEEAKERERQYERERQERIAADRGRPQATAESNNRAPSRSRPLPTTPAPPQRSSDEESLQAGEREYLQQEWTNHHTTSKPSAPQFSAPQQPPRPLPSPAPYQPPARSLNTPTTTLSQPPPPPPPIEPSPRPLPNPTPSLPTRPLPNPKTYAPPSSTPPSTHPSPSKPPTSKPTPFAPKLPSSLLHREMELDRQRQQEWEEAQKATKAAAATGPGLQMDGAAGAGPGESWDVNQYGYLGGDSQNRGRTGIGFGARRQIVGPRPEPGPGGR